MSAALQSLWLKPFLHLIDSFNLVQSVMGSTHELGHTLDLVLSCGLPVSNLEISNAFFSDHMPVLFDISIPCFSKPSIPARRCRIINSSTAAQFSSVFQNSSETYVTFPSCFDTEELTSLFNSTCQKCFGYCCSF